jgi:hypothetical protein
MEINLGSIQIPINAATKTFAILAKRGAGKTYTGAVMAEEFFKNNIPFIVFDPIDVWFGLRINKNGKDKGLPVVVFGIEHADIKLDREMGRQIAQAVIRDNVSCVISTFGLPKVAQRHLIAEFADEILNINNTPRHIFIEEAHEYVPQRVFGAMGKTFNAVSNLVVMGRNRGLGVTLLSQRAATVNKDVLTQIDTLIAMRSIGPQDRKALRDWVEYHTAEGDFEKFISSLPSLPTGEGWLWSPEFLGKFEYIKIRKRETFHIDREKIGSKFEMPHLDQIDIQGFIEKFNKTIKSTPKQLTKTERRISIESPAEQVVEPADLRNLRNEYESKLLSKDIEIRNLLSTIENVRKIVGGVTTTANILVGSSGKFDALIENLPSYEKDIMKAISQHPHIPFTRSQLAIKAKKSYTSSAYLTAIRKLLKLGLLEKQGTDIVYKG